MKSRFGRCSARRVATWPECLRVAQAGHGSAHEAHHRHGLHVRPVALLAHQSLELLGRRTSDTATRADSREGVDYAGIADYQDMKCRSTGNVYQFVHVY